MTTFRGFSPRPLYCAGSSGEVGEARSADGKSDAATSGGVDAGVA